MNESFTAGMTVAGIIAAGWLVWWTITWPIELRNAMLFRDTRNLAVNLIPWVFVLLVVSALVVLLGGGS